MTERIGESDILDILRVRSDTLSPAERAIAELVLADPIAAHDRKIGELAQLARSSEATVTRFCRSVGLQGYTQFRLALAVALERRRTGRLAEAGLAMLGDLSPGDAASDIIKKVAFANTQAVELTVDQLDLRVLGAAVDALIAARRVLAFGVGSSATVAIDAVEKLTLAGVAAHSTNDIHTGLMTVALYGADDVVLAFSHSGRARETVEVLEHAAARGATGIVVTSDASSPAARAAGLCLVTAAREMGLRSGGVASRIASLTVVDCIFVLMSHRRFDVSTEAGERMHQAVSAHVIGSGRGAK
jgi:DNA-binding MurR/RpiR family transcriptional regulator